MGRARAELGTALRGSSGPEQCGVRRDAGGRLSCFQPLASLEVMSYRGSVKRGGPAGAAGQELARERATKDESIEPASQQEFAREGARSSESRPGLAACEKPSVSLTRIAGETKWRRRCAGMCPQRR
jgi:hypothetical protein